MTFDFAHIVFIGMQIGITMREVGRMRYGTWKMLYSEYRHQWNMRIKKMIYADNEEKSVLDL